MLCVLTLMFFGVVAADVLVTYPAGGEVLSGFEEYTITWTESNIVPVISDLDSYIIFLHAGTNENYVCTHSRGDLFSPSDKQYPHWPRAVQAPSCRQPTSQILCPPTKLSAQTQRIMPSQSPLFSNHELRLYLHK